jgi:hypothetical protein
MNTEELLEYDDLGDALREGRALRPARGYRFLLAQGDLNFQSRQVSDPVPLGRQLLEAAPWTRGKVTACSGSCPRATSRTCG